MVKIALITEGITDQYVIKPIIENYFDSIDFVFNPITPPVDETDKQTGHGSWTNVVRACTTENFEELFNYNDYVVIQIDADISYTKGFDVAHSENGITLSPNILYDNIISKLQSFIPKETLNLYAHRFLFAIGILTIECWLVGLVNSKHTNNEIHNCLFKLNKMLAKKNLKPINQNNKNNFQSKTTYQKLAKEFKNKNLIEIHSKSNIGFEKFVNQLFMLKLDNN